MNKLQKKSFVSFACFRCCPEDDSETITIPNQRQTPSYMTSCGILISLSVLSSNPRFVCFRTCLRRKINRSLGKDSFMKVKVCFSRLQLTNDVIPNPILNGNCEFRYTKTVCLASISISITGQNETFRGYMRTGQIQISLRICPAFAVHMKKPWILGNP